jgi:hypothetical protein
MFKGLANGLKYSNGYDLMFSTNRAKNIRSNVPMYLLGVGIDSFHFADNVNISLILVFLCIFIGLLFKLMNKITSK